MVRMNNLRNREKKNGTKVWWRLVFVLSLQTHYEGGEVWERIVVVGMHGESEIEMV